MKFSKCTHLLSTIFLFLIGSCNNLRTVIAAEKVTITFVQLPFLKFSYDENGENNGYFFKNEEIAVTRIEFDNGHFLSEEEINEISRDKLNYKIPELSGDGYWSFTQFVTVFDIESGFARNYLEPLDIKEDFDVFFAIYG